MNKYSLTNEEMNTLIFNMIAEYLIDKYDYETFARQSRDIEEFIQKEFPKIYQEIFDS